MKRIDIRLRASDPSLDTGWLWRLAKGYAKEAWDGKMALHMPLLDMGQAKTRNEWVLSHLPSGMRVGVIHRPLKDAVVVVQVACARFSEWRHAMEFDHHALDAGLRHWPYFDMQEFKHVLREADRDLDMLDPRLAIARYEEVKHAYSRNG